jgi:hypothetical protein
MDPTTVILTVILLMILIYLIRSLRRQHLLKWAARLARSNSFTYHPYRGSGAEFDFVYKGVKKTVYVESYTFCPELYVSLIQMGNNSLHGQAMGI